MIQYAKDCKTMAGTYLSYRSLVRLKRVSRELSDRLGKTHHLLQNRQWRNVSSSGRSESPNIPTAETTHFGFQTVAEDKKEEKGKNSGKSLCKSSIDALALFGKKSLDLFNYQYKYIYVCVCVRVFTRLHSI